MIELESFEEAEKQDVWVNAMREELQMIEKNQTLELVVDKPRGRDVIGLK